MDDGHPRDQPRTIRPSSSKARKGREPAYGHSPTAKVKVITQQAGLVCTVHVCLSVYAAACLCVCLSPCAHVCVVVCLCDCVSIGVSVCLCVSIFCVSVYIFLCVSVIVYLCLRVFVCLYFSVSV